MGRNCISAAYKIPVTGATHQVALHVNFMMGTGTFTKGATDDDFSNLGIHLSLLHITARSAKNQLSIEENGPSILSAAKSIHCGPGNDWDWTRPQVDELCIDIGATSANLQAALVPFGANYMQGIRDGLRDEIRRNCRNRYVDVAFTGDSTW